MTNDHSGAPRRGLQTTLIHRARGECDDSLSSPIYQTSVFAAEDSAALARVATAVQPANFYLRYGNPNQERPAQLIASVEDAEAGLVTASGMAAIAAAILSNVSSGDHIIAQTSIYAGSRKLLTDVLPRYGIDCSFVPQDASAIRAAHRPNTKLVYTESPSNPLLAVTDLEAVAKFARQEGLISICDSTLATPINQRPLDHGIDMVVHSATKHLGGHHDLMLGVLVGNKSLIERAWEYELVMGAVASPFECWLLERGLKTLGLRMRRHNENALALAEFLNAERCVRRVYYPGMQTSPQYDLARRQMPGGFGGLLAVEFHAGYDAAQAVADKLELVRLAPSLGGPETLVVHPAAMWAREASPAQQAAAGIAPGLLRIALGLEDIDDITRDFAQAIAAL